MSEGKVLGHLIDDTGTDRTNAPKSHEIYRITKDELKNDVLDVNLPY